MSEGETQRPAPAEPGKSKTKDRKMKTLEIKKQGSQYEYKIINFGQEVVSSQFGTFDRNETISQAFARFGKCEVVDQTECVVEILDRDGQVKTVSMTRSCYDATSNKTVSFSRDQFLGRIVAEGGVAITEDSEVPF